MHERSTSRHAGAQGFLRWRLARDSAARRVGLVEKELSRTVAPAKLPDR